MPHSNRPQQFVALTALVLTLALGAAFFMPPPAAAQAGACAHPAFAPAVAHVVRQTTGFTEIDVVAADFNNDGRVDLATANAATRDVSVLPGAGGGDFDGAFQYPTGFEPTGIDAGDFNNDARPDLVTSNGRNDNGDLTVLFNDGSGGFARTKPIVISPEGVNTSTTSVVVADFNLDGNRDFAAVSSHNVSVSLGDGAGNFTTEAFAFGHSSAASSAAAGDFNGDGKPDLAVSVRDSNSVALLLGDGAGHLGAATLFAVGTRPLTLAVADFNNDNKADLATANQGSHNVSVLLGNGAGGFAAARHFTSGNQLPWALAATDFDADGRPDLLVASAQPGGLTLLAGDGAGNFTPSVNAELPNAVPAAVVLATLDAGARRDVAVADQALGRVFVLRAECAAGPSAPTLRPAAGSLRGREGQAAVVRVIREGNIEAASSVSYSLSGLTATAGTDFTPVSGTLSFAAGETFKEFQFNTLQDSLNEGVERLNVHLSNPTGAVVATPNPFIFFLSDDEPTPVLSISDVTVPEGDEGTTNATFTLTLDRPTLATVAVLYETEPGAASAAPDYFPASGSLFFAPGETVKTVSVAVRGDDTPEINETFFLALKNPSQARLAPPARGTALIFDDDSTCPGPAFAPAVKVNVGTRPQGLAAADFNGDNRPDLAVTSEPGMTSEEVVILRNNGAGGFSVTSRVAVGPGPNALAAADFTGDGKVDLAATLQGADAVALLVGTGTGAFAAPVNFPVGNFPLDLAAADFNGDSRPDLAVANAGSRSISVLLGNGAGGFGAARHVNLESTAAPVPVSLAVADFDRDNRPDLVAGSGSGVNGDLNSGVTVLFGDGAGGFSRQAFAFVPGFSEVATGDINRDGHADVIDARTAFGLVSVLYGGSAGASYSGVDHVAQSGPQGPVVVDFNGDSNPDFAVANRAGSASVSVFFGNGTDGYATAPTHLPVGNAPWQVVAADFNGDGRPDMATPDFSDGTVSVLLNACTGAAPSAFQFASSAFAARESEHAATVEVVRTGDASAAASVTVASADATASERTDYITALATLRFAPGETRRTLQVLITDDARPEARESLTLSLSAPAGAAVGGRATASVFIVDDDTPPPSANPIDETLDFVRQHYHDFLSREPDQAGLDFWAAGIENCGADQECRRRKRVDTSAAFFLSIEFQQTGYQVIRVYKASFADTPQRPRGLPRYLEFLRDTREVGAGVVVGVGDWEERLRRNTQEFARRWVQSAEFVAQFPATMTAPQFVDKLFANSEVTPSAAERGAALAAFGAGGPAGRASALLNVTNSGSVYNRQYNRAFVLMQYIGYLRRSPDDPPDQNFDGYLFWLGKLDSFTQPGEDVRAEGVALRRVRRAEMIRAFIESTEYRQRFGQ